MDYTEFKVGEKIRATEACSAITEGKEYEVTLYNQDTGWVTVRDNDGDTVAHPNYEFEKVVAPKHGDAPERQFKTGDVIRAKNGTRHNGKVTANVIDPPYGDKAFNFDGEEMVWADWWDRSPSYLLASLVEKVEPEVKEEPKPEPERDNKYTVDDRVYFNTVPGLDDEYGPGWGTVVKVNRTFTGTFDDYTVRLDEDSSVWYFQDDDFAEPPTEKEEPVERKDHTALIDEAQGYIDALYVLGFNKSADVFGRLRDALIEESYR